MSESFVLPAFPQIFPDFDNLGDWFTEFLAELRMVSVAVLLGAIPFLPFV